MISTDYPLRLVNSNKQDLQQHLARFRFTFGLTAVIAVLLMAFIMGLLKIYSPDLGFHLKSAAWMLENKQFIHTDTFSYGSSAHKYFDLQWLYQLLIYTLYKKGEAVLIVANALFIVISLVLVWLRVIKNDEINKANVKLGFFAFMLLLFIQPLSFEIRPQVVSWIFLNCTLLFLESYKKRNHKAVFVLPVIMLLWANMHSIAILGLVVIGIYNVGLFLEKKKTDRRLLVYSGLSFAAFFITPYFFDGFLYSLSQFGIISGNSLFKSYLGELQSPFTAREINMLGSKYFTNPLLIIHLSALLSVFSIFSAIKLKQFTNALLLAAFLVLLYLAHRNYGIFFLVSLPLFVKYILSWLEQRNSIKQKISSQKKEVQPANTEPVNQKLYKRFALASIMLSVFISVTCFTDGYRLFIHSPNRFGFITDHDQLPVDATAFLNKNGVKGKLLNHLDFGGYLMANYKEPVFIDGRMDLFEEDFFEEYYESLTEPNGLKKLLGAYSPDIVIFPYIKASYWWNYFLSNKERSGYKAVYFDGLSVIYLKVNNYPDLPALTEAEILKHAGPSAAVRLKTTIEASKPRGLMVLINGLWQKQSFSIDDQNKATWCFTNGFDTAGIHYSVTGIENSTIHTPNIFKNLSIFFQDKKMYDEAELCETKSE